MNIKEIERKGVDWKWSHVCCGTVMNLRAPENAVNFLTGYGTVRFLRLTLACGVSVVCFGYGVKN